MSQQGIGLEQYLKMIGSDVASFRETTRATAEKQTRTEILLSAVADAENIEINDEDLKAEYAKMAEAYGMKAEDVEKYVDAEGLKADLRRRKAIDVIAASGVAAVTKAKKTIRKPAAKKTKAEDAETLAEEAPAKKTRKTTQKTEEKAE